MGQNIRTKICGLRTGEDMAATISAGACYAGFVFFPKSPRHLEIETARELALSVPAGIVRVALTVNAGDGMLDALMAAVPLDMLQLHGSESPERVAEIKARYGLPVMKALGMSGAEDLGAIDIYSEVADQLLIDAKPPERAALPGGNGRAFDWRLIAGRSWTVPWMLAGGLTPGNVAEAVRLSGARQVDVSSGVESAPGMKNAEMIHAFVAAAQA
ncbi:MAG: phosphoribosylanthranilate isomerase [Pseudomonadota bacterium]